MQALALMLAAALVASAASAAPATYTLEPEHSFVHFELLHFGTSTMRGRIGPVTGAVLLDPAAGSGEVSLRIDTRTVSTGLGLFDARIREPDLLNTPAFPEAYFVASKFRYEGGQLAEVRGEFTLRGVSQPLSLHARRFACRNDKDAEVCGGDFEAELLRSDFGATFGLPLVGNRVRLLVQVEGRRAPYARP